MRILVIEDNIAFSQVLCGFLIDEGFEVLTAADGRRGIRAALAFTPDLVLLDYNLGDMTGLEVAGEIGAAPALACVPVILLSSVADDPRVRAAFGSLPNCRAALLKSCPVPEILAAVKEALGPHGGPRRGG